MVERLGIVGGSAFLEGALLADTTPTRIETARGTVRLHVAGDYAFLFRHGEETYSPPHRVPHHAHVLAFEALMVREVVGLNSVGSLRSSLVPGTAVVPDDYASVAPPPSFAEDERLHIVPVLDDSLRRLLLEAAGDTEGPVANGGVYVQTSGPRFETRAEIRWLAPVGDVIGMTAASEATLFQERNIAYALLGIVDNYANGIGNEPLTFDAYERQLVRNGQRARKIVEAILARRRGR